MKCHICGKNEASIHYLEIVEGHKTSQWICSECAEREGISPPTAEPLSHGGLEAFLGGMLSSAATEPRAREPQAEGPTCEVCGYPYSQFREKWLLGCPACYSAFRQELLPVLRRYHGDVRHVGKVPLSRGPQASLRREVARLKSLLQQAIDQESYEEAARLRDSIREKESQIELLTRRDVGPANNATRDRDEEDGTSSPSGGSQA
jgi:protein arginine kinase activator